MTPLIYIYISRISHEIQYGKEQLNYFQCTKFPLFFPSCVPVQGRIISPAVQDTCFLQDLQYLASSPIEAA
jgi:hypothetical protein